MKKLALLALCTISCATHERANIKADETFVVQLEKPASRGGIVEIGLQGLLLGANYFAEKSAKSLVSTYDESVSVNDYYQNKNGQVSKTYKTIHIKKYSKPSETEDKSKLQTIISDEIAKQPVSRGSTSSTMVLNDVVRVEQDDFLNFDAVIEIISDDENPGVSRLSFNDLRIFFSKTRVYTDENLNAKISVRIDGEWRSTDGSPMTRTLIEQEFDFKDLKYGAQNQIKNPILTPWYYDIPIVSDIENESKYGVLKVTVRVEEYEGNKSKYVSKLPGILSDNKNSIIEGGAKMLDN